MFERFTEGAIKVIMLAQQESRRLGHNFVGTEQILLGLIGQKEGVAARVVRSSGVTLKAARAEVEKVIGRGQGLVTIEIPFTPRTKRLLELSWEEARRLHQDYIGTEHLLLGMLREGSGVGCRVLLVLNIDLVKLYKQVVTACGRSADDFGLVLPSQPSFPVFPGDTANFYTEPFTWYASDAILIIQRAWGIADTFCGGKEIGAQHLFLALLRDSDSIPKAVTAAGLSLAQIRQALMKNIEPGDGSPPESRPFSADAQKILEYAWLEGVELQQNLITKECIMLGLLRQENGVAAEVLKNLSADSQLVRQSLIESLKSAQPPKSNETSPANTSAVQSAIKYPMWMGPYGMRGYLKAIVMSIGIFAIFGFLISLIGSAIYFLSIESTLAPSKKMSISNTEKRSSSMIGTWTDGAGLPDNYICFDDNDTGVFFKQPELLTDDKVLLHWSASLEPSQSVFLTVKDSSGQRITYQTKIKLIDPTHMVMRFPYGKERALVRKKVENKP